MSTGQLAIQKTLNEALLNARLRNPSFSLRALARKLNLSPAALSEILNGKRPVTRKVAQKIVLRLGLDPKTSEGLLLLFPEKKTKAGGPRQAPVTELDMDRFRTLSDWYHHAILSLAETDGFRDDPKWIGEQLNIRAQDAQAALERLERLGMLEKSLGRLAPTGIRCSGPDDSVDLAFRKLHEQYLEMSKNVLSEFDLMFRDFFGVTMAIDPSKIAGAKKKIRKFVGDLCAYLESDRKLAVYRLNLQLIPLTRGLK